MGKKKVVRWQWILNDVVHPAFGNSSQSNRMNVLTLAFYSEDELNNAVKSKSAMFSPFVPSQYSTVVGKAEWTRTEFDE